MNGHTPKLPDPLPEEVKLWLATEHPACVTPYVARLRPPFHPTGTPEYEICREGETYPIAYQSPGNLFLYPYYGPEFSRFYLTRAEALRAVAGFHEEAAESYARQASKHLASEAERRKAAAELWREYEAEVKANALTAQEVSQ